MQIPLVLVYIERYLVKYGWCLIAIVRNISKEEMCIYKKKRKRHGTFTTVWGILAHNEATQTYSSQ